MYPLTGLATKYFRFSIGAAKKVIPTNAVRIVLNKEIKDSSDSKADRVTTIFCSLIPMFLPNGMAKASYRWYKDLAALSVKIEEYIRKEVSE